MGIPSIKNKLTSKDLLRKQLLSTAIVDSPTVDTAKEYISTLNNESIASIALDKRKGPPFIQPRGGFSRFKDQRFLTQELVKAGADFIPLTIDSHTRHNDYISAATLLDRSELEDKNLLNGYPLVNHGYKISRQLFSDIQNPISLRHGTPDARLLVEVALASGITEIEGGALSYCMPYARTYPITRSLLHWQYVDRVCALVSTDNMPIHRESFGVLTATLVPPVMVVVVNLCELLLAAEQGITSFSVSFSQTGSITQDILLSKVLRKTSEFYLNKFGFDNVSVYLVYHQWMGSFPYDYDMANSLISNSAQIGSMVGADKIITKTKEEARGIPSVQNNTDAVRLVRYVLDRNKFNYEHLDIDIENSSLNKQVSSVMRAIFKLPVKEFWNSVNFAIKNGYIDIPFAPHESNKNQLITQRGKDNGIYILDPGKVPIPNEYLIDDIRAVANNDHLKSKDSLFKIMMQDINLMVE